MYTRGETLDVKGAKEVVAALRKIGAPQEVVDAAFAEQGRAVAGLASTLAPVRTGRLRSAISSRMDGSMLTVSAGSEIVPYAYTYHSGVVGKPPETAGMTPKTSGGYMVFRVNGYYRNGYFVGGYSALRRIHQNPYLFIAWNRLQKQLITRVEQALTKVVSE